MTADGRTAVIVGVGEITDRVREARLAREPVRLMADALREADADAGGGWLSRVQSVDLVGLVSWRYRDPVGLLCEQLGVAPERRVNASMGGETPVRLIHEAALAIARGEIEVAAVVGGEATHARQQAKRAGVELPWTPMASAEEAVRFPSSSFAMSPVAKALGVREPVQIYPLYEMATQAAWRQSPAEAQAESAALWARYAEVAAQNPDAWIRSGPTADEIAAVGPDNRLIAWPYPKLMVANPSVNQAAAILVTSLAAARAAGIADEWLIRVWGGAAAREPEDYLQRDRYDHSTSQEAVLDRAVEIAGGDARRFNHLELYSCFPVVPKMALRTLGLGEGAPPPTVAGGLTFFGAPLNNYMAHAAVAMVRRLRQRPGELGLLYGQGGYVNKHHALVFGSDAAPEPLAQDYSVQAQANAARGAVPLLDGAYVGAAEIETYTVRFGRDGEPVDGVVVARTPEGSRAMARTPAADRASLEPLLSTTRNAIGSRGVLYRDDAGTPTWTTGSAMTGRG